MLDKIPIILKVFDSIPSRASRQREYPAKLGKIIIENLGYFQGLFKMINVPIKSVTYQLFHKIQKPVIFHQAQILKNRIAYIPKIIVRIEEDCLTPNLNLFVIFLNFTTFSSLNENLF